MMNDLGIQEQPTQMSLHHQSVLKNITGFSSCGMVWAFDESIPVLIYKSPTFPMAVEFHCPSHFRPLLRGIPAASVLVTGNKPPRTLVEQA